MTGKRRQMPPPWPGITAPDCTLCSWSWLGGIRQVKFWNGACTVHWAAIAEAARAAEAAAEGAAR